MAKRKIIQIDEDLCNGCGKCAIGCPEGAIQMIDGKARLVSEMYCDGLGECIGSCPVEAITVIEREAEPYDEYKTMGNIAAKGENTIKAHLKHLLNHGETEYYNQGLKYLKDNNIPVPNLLESDPGNVPCNCPSMQEKSMKRDNNQNNESTGAINSELSTWPVQLNLLMPGASFFKDADLLIAADCTPFAFGDFHRKFVKGKIPIIFCPKLDNATERYIDKLSQIFSNHNIKSISIVRMEVPCCGGTTYIVEEALKRSGKNIIIREYTIGIDGSLK